MTLLFIANIKNIKITFYLFWVKGLHKFTKLPIIKWLNLTVLIAKPKQLLNNHKSLQKCNPQYKNTVWNLHLKQS